MKKKDWKTVLELPTPFVTGGAEYRVRIEGTERKDGTWAGRVVFESGGKSIRTDQETSQPDRDAVVYWGTGLEQVYLEGAFERATERSQG